MLRIRVEQKNKKHFLVQYCSDKITQFLQQKNNREIKRKIDSNKSNIT